MPINPNVGRGIPVTAQTSAQEPPSTVSSAVQENPPVERGRAGGMSVQLSTLSDMSRVRRSRSELNLPRKTEVAVSLSRSFREPPVSPGKEAETGDAKDADWESVLDASVGADDIPSRKGANADTNIRMTPFGPSHMAEGSARVDQTARRSQSDIGLSRHAAPGLPSSRSFREPPTSASVALLDGAVRSDDGIWNEESLAQSIASKGKAKLEEFSGVIDLHALPDLHSSVAPFTSEEIVASWLSKAELNNPRRRGEAEPSSSTFRGPPIGSSRRSVASLPSIAEQQDDLRDDQRAAPSTSFGARRSDSVKSRPEVRERQSSTPAGAAPHFSRGTVKDRFAQLVNIKKVPFTPPIRVEQWNLDSTLEICQGWRNSQSGSPAIPELSRLMALNFERAHAGAIPEERRGQRLLPKGAGDDDYYREMIATFLKAAGIENSDEVLNSFKTTGTGALHRQPVMSSSTVGGAVSSIAQIAASSHPIAKTALSAVQLILTAVTTKLSFDSAELRLRNAGTEEIMPLGKADASPSAKTGPNVFGAAATLAWRLPKIRQCVQRMAKAQILLDAAKSRLAAADISPADRLQAENDVRAAGEKLGIEYARFCLRNELKTDYKTASESAKIEYEGNKRYLGVSGASAAFAVTSTVLGILPHAAAAAVTGGVSAAAVTAVALMYVGYQLSSGPSKDGEAKAKRAIVALGKSLDLLGGNAAKQQKERAQAYQTYIKEKRLWRRPEVRAQAKAKLLVTLDDIARRDTTEHDVKPLANWEAYADYRQQTEAAAGDPHAMQELEAAFTQAHQAEFKASTIADSWKSPYRMRLDSMGRILLGKSGKTLAALLKSAVRTGQASSGRSERRTSAQAQIHAGLRADVKASLRDWISFELAQSNIKSALSEGEGPGAEAGLQSAARALAAIKDVDAQALFTGDGRGQVEATELAKRLTAGEVERYTITNAGSATLAGVANTFGAAASLGLSIKNEIKISHGIHAPKTYNDQNDARVFLQGTAPVTAPYTSAERARFQKTSMAKLLGTLARNGDPVSLKLDIAEADPSAMDMSDPRIDVALDKLMDDLERLADLPDDIKLSIGGKSIATGKLSGTSNYFDWRYKQASAGTKAKFQMRRTGMIANNMHVSVTSPISQLVAQVPLSMTRRAANRGQEMSHDVRDRLTDLTRRSSSVGTVDEGADVDRTPINSRI
ncbi:hypothetical protein [Collimonas silvisoli]|uniref:hypothetical protein n=1 Tax=Collimonas silvisoli TaxID=2825884 RepID=UPI001B8ACD2A|nr:hypothetical protein [Collimonas silvisoli]